MRKTLEKDLEFLELVATEPIRVIALEKKVPESYLYKWLIRIRNRIDDSQNYLNRIYAMQKRSKRVKKMTIKGALAKEESDEEFFGR